MTRANGAAYAAIYAGAPWHRKVLAIPEQKRLAAFGFWAATIVLCQTYRNDGFIPLEQLAAAFPCTPQQRDHLVGLLVGAELFDAADGGIVVHDYLEWNRSAAEIVASRRAMSEGGRKGGKASGKPRPSPPSKPTLEGSAEQCRDSSEEEEHEQDIAELCPSCGQVLTQGECWACASKG